MTQIVMLSDEGARERWNCFVRGMPQGHLMQSWEWGSFKESLGWHVERIGLERDGKLVAGVQVLLKSLPWLPFSIAYIPKGPVVDWSDSAAVEGLFDAVHKRCRKRWAIFLKMEPNSLDDDEVHAVLRQNRFVSVAQTNQPRSTLIIDLQEGEEALLANMRKTTRKLMRRAGREGVEIVEGDEEDLEAFYRVITATSHIKDISVHHKVFYRQAWQAFAPSGAVKLMLAKHQGRVVGAKLIFFFGDRSMHFWGGVSQQGRDRYAAYLMQWEALKWAIAHGCHYSDLWGIPDEVGALLKDGQEVPKNRQDGLWGVYTFKRGFGGQVEYYVGAYDYAYRPWLYKLGMKLLASGRTVDEMSKWLETVSGGAVLGCLLS